MKTLRAFLFIILSAWQFQTVTAAERPVAPDSSNSTTESSASKAIPLAEVQERLAGSEQAVSDIADDVNQTDLLKVIGNQMPALEREIAARYSEQNKILAQRPSLDILRAMERGWQRLRDDLASKQAALARELQRIEGMLEQLDDTRDVWSQTLDATRDAAPKEVLQRMQSHLTELKQVAERYEAYRTAVLRVQSRVTASGTRVTGALGAIRDKRELTLSQIFVKDSPALWDEQVLARAQHSVSANSAQTMAAQGETLRLYVTSDWNRLALALIFLALVAAALWWLGAKLRDQRGDEGASASGSLAFDMPIASSFVMTAFVSRWMFPEAPRLLWVAIGILALVPTILLLRRALNATLVPALYATLIFYLVDQVKTLAAGLDAVPRLLLILEMIAVVIFVGFYLRYLRNQPVGTKGNVQRRLLYIGAWAVLFSSAATVLASSFGYVSFANLLGNALLTGAYYAVFLFALVIVIDGLVSLALVSRPLSLLTMIRRHAAVVHKRIGWVVRLGALILWFSFFLDRLALRDAIETWVRSVLAYNLSFGSIEISIADICAFVLTICAAFLVSRFIQFMLDEEVYPRTHLRRGIPYAISRTVHYLILVGGFLLAVAALGIDMTKITILAGAFSVGVGFGLQNIFNNFVSGLILLFERPVQVGDMIEVEDTAGVVERIGIRASIVRTSSSAEIIVPNGKLISERLVNWTLTSRTRVIELDVAVAHGPEPKRVIELINGVAASHPEVSKTPPPQTLLTRMGPDWLGFQLRAAVDHIEEWMQIKSELSVNVADTLAANNIPLK